MANAINADMVLAEMLPFGEGIEDIAARHAAFFGGLDESHRIAARVAMDFFSLMRDLNTKIGISKRHPDSDERVAAYGLALEYATTALATLARFGRLLGCRDFQEAGEKLDRLSAYAEKCGWIITPPWWRKVKSKNTSYFTGQLKIYTGKRNEALIAAREAAKAKAESRRKSAKKAETEGGAI